MRKVRFVEERFLSELPRHCIRALAAAALFAAAASLIAATLAGSPAGALTLGSGLALAASRHPTPVRRALRDLGLIAYYLGSASLFVGLRVGHMSIGFMLLHASVTRDANEFGTVIRRGVFGAWGFLACSSALSVLESVLSLKPKAAPSWSGPEPEKPEKSVIRGVVWLASSSLRLLVAVATAVVYHLLLFSLLAWHIEMLTLSGGMLLLLCLFFPETTGSTVKATGDLYCGALAVFADGLYRAMYLTVAALLIVSALSGHAAEGVALALALMGLTWSVWIWTHQVSALFFLGTYSSPCQVPTDPRPMPDRKPRAIATEPQAQEELRRDLLHAWRKVKR